MSLQPSPHCSHRNHFLASCLTGSYSVSGSDILAYYPLPYVWCFPSSPPFTVCRSAIIFLMNPDELHWPTQLLLPLYVCLAACLTGFIAQQFSSGFLPDIFFKQWSSLACACPFCMPCQITHIPLSMFLHVERKAGHRFLWSKGVIITWSNNISPSDFGIIQFLVVGLVYTLAQILIFLCVWFFCF